MTATTTTFAELCRLEPRLRTLEAEVKATAARLRRRRNRCANKAWYSPAGDGWSPRDWMSSLVGWGRSGRQGESPEAAAFLRSSDAFDACYDHLYQLLPDCANCGCL